MNRELQRAIDEPIALVAYDVRWPARFATERDRLIALFPHAFIAIEHIGSTAVQGLAAKPVIDMLGGVESMAVADSLIEPLCRHGYTTSAEFNATLPDRRWLMRTANGHRTHHLHIVEHGGAQWRERLAFRDALRGDEALARRYLELKRALAKEHPNDREAYTQAKSAFVHAVIDGRAVEQR